MKLASHLHMSLYKCKEQTSSLEFHEWLVYLDKVELDTVTQDQHYLAQIAMEIRRSINPKASLSLDQFKLKFNRASNGDDLESMTDEEIEEHKKLAAARSKMYWSALAGISIPIDYPTE